MFWKPKAIEISEGVRMIVQQMLDHPEDWRQGQYHFGNIKHRDINIWTANGDDHIAFEGNECLSWAEKRHIANGIKKSIALRLRA
jgi:hypothetical protein